MKRILSVLFVGSLVVFALSPAVYGADGLYAHYKLGLGILTDSDVTDAATPGTSIELEYDDDLAIAIGIGYAVGAIRGEAELAFLNNDLDKVVLSGVPQAVWSGGASSRALLLNGYYDFLNSTPVTPFVSAGIGIARVDVGNINYVAGGGQQGGHDTVFAYQLGAGVAYEITRRFTVDVTYRYFGTSDADFRPNMEMEYGSHNIYAGLRVSF
jgi:opacity protein-like surface antigen